MTLREQIARRLTTVARFSSSTPALPPWHGKEISLGLADEVIRLMEWARRECPIKVSDVSAGGFLETVSLVPNLTLPPEDWKP